MHFSPNAEAQTTSDGAKQVAAGTGGRLRTKTKTYLYAETG